MANITFRNVLDTETEFKKIQEDSLLVAVYEYARQSSDELYEKILEEKVSLLVNNSIIEVDDWKDTILNDEDEVIITPIIEGESGGIIQSVIGLTLIVASFIPGPWTPFAPYMQMIGASLLLGGMSQLMFTPDLPTLSSIGGAKDTQTYNWSGIKTTAKADSPIPIVYGTHMVGGNVISLFSEVEGDINYLYMLLALCEGEIEGICQYDDNSEVCSTTDRSSSSYRDPAIFFDDQPMKAYTDVDWWYRKGKKSSEGWTDYHNPNYQTRIPGFSGVRLQNDDSREIPYSDDGSEGIVYTTTTEVDSVKMQFKAPALYKVVDGKITKHEVKYKLQYKTTAESTYHTLTTSKWTATTEPSGYPTSYTSCRYKDNTYLYGDNPIANFKYKITVTKNELYDSNIVNPEEEPTVGLDIVFPYKMYLDIEKYDLDGNLIGGVESRTIENNVRYHYEFDSKTPETPELILNDIQYTDTSFFVDLYMVTIDHFVANPANGGKYSVIVKSTETTGIEELLLEGKSKDGVWGVVTIDFNTVADGSGRDEYDIRIFRTDGGASDDFEVENKLVLSSVTEIVEGEFIYPYTALLGLKIKATGQLSGSPPNVTVLVKGRKISVPSLTGGSYPSFEKCYWDDTDGRWEYDGSVRYWDESTYTTEYCSNSMLVVRDLLTDTRIGLGEYITTSDLYTFGVIEAIKRCHKEWSTPTDTDVLKWWSDAPTATKWLERLVVDGRNIPTAVLSFATKTARFYKSTTVTDPTLYSATVYFVTSNSMPAGNKYTFNFTITNSSRYNLNAYFYVYTWWAYGGMNGRGAALTTSTLTNISSGTQSVTFTNPLDGVNIFVVKFVQRTMDLTISSVSMTEDERENYHTFNGVIESEQSALAALSEICNSFRCWPIWYNGKFNFVVDEDDTPVHTLSKSNTTSFSQAWTPLSEIPYKLTGQFTDKNNNYNMRSIVARTTSTSIMKLNERSVGLKGITNRWKAERELIHKLNKVTNETHTVNIKCGLDSIHATAGDIVYVQDDLPVWGYSGRIARSNVSSALLVIDTNYALSGDDIIRYQTASNNFVTATISSISASRNITVTTWVGTPCDDAVYTLGYGSSTTPKKFRLLSVNRTNDNEVEIIGLEHLSSLYTTASVVIVPDIPSLPEPKRPDPPKGVNISQLSITLGIGFAFKASIPAKSSNVVEIVVEMADDVQGPYRYIATLPADNPQYYYIDNNLKLDSTYYFRFYSRAVGGRMSDPMQLSYYLSSTYYEIPAPSGIRIKGVADNSTEFNTKDVTILWNPVTLTTGSSYIGEYKVEVYKMNSDDEQKLVRTTYVSNAEFTYTYEMNSEDDGEDDDCDTPDPDVYFRLYTRLINGVESQPAPMFKITNSIPSTVTNVVAYSNLKGVGFTWDASSEKDFRKFSCTIKIGSGVYSSEFYVSTNSYIRTLTPSEVSLYGADATIYIKVKAVDWYNQSSTNWSTEVYANAGKVSDNIFGIVASKSGGTGTLAELYDGDLDSGGILIS